MKRTLRPITFLPPLVLVASLAQAHERPHADAYYGAGEGARVAQSSPAVALNRAAAESRKAVVTSVDARRGVPSFLWASRRSPDAYAPGATAEAAARAYLERFAPLYKVSRADVATARVASVHDKGRGGIVVTMRQRVGDVDVFRSDVKLLLNRDKSLVAIADAPHAAASGVAALSKRGEGFKLGYDDALAGAFGDLNGYSVGARAFRDTGRSAGGYRYFEVSPASLGLRGVTMATEPRVKRVFFPLADRLVPAYYLELEAQNGGENEAYAYVVSAVDGSVLYRSSLVAYESFNYRVYAENDPARHYPPTDSPAADMSPHPTGVPDGSEPDGFASQITVPMEGFNQYNDPWLPPGATVVQGNNVKAYADHDEIPLPTGGTGPLDQQTGSDPTAEATAANTFNYSFDPTAAPTVSPQQIKASVTQLFYVTNWLHDYWYDSGFDEASGVAQNDNYGRAPAALGGDAMEAQAQDKFLIDARNNANMSTPADGARPRMQMFVWTGLDVSKSVTTSVPGLTFTELGTAGFGPKDFTVAGPVRLVADGGGVSPTDACEAIAPGSLAGQIALLDRGTCGFAIKVLNAQNAGAIGAIVVNNAATAPINMGGVPTAFITIGSVMVTQANGQALKAALAGGAVTATIARDADTEIDGTQDNGIVAHEWGHYLHHRLVQCGLQQCGGMSEGWGDFVAMHLMVREGDDLSGAYATAYYATSGGTTDAAYFGIRRYPRSTDRAKNPLTFKHIGNQNALPPGVPNAPAAPTNSQVHNAGEVWSVTLFDAYAKLLAAHPFDEAKRRMADYLAGGMKLTPTEPSFTQQRDAILAYTFSQDRADFDLLAQAFAGRGMGVGAVSPPVSGGEREDPANPNSPQTFNEVVENFELKGNVVLAGLDLDDAVHACDGDGILDRGETGRLTVSIKNVGMARLAPSQITVTTASPGVEILNGGAATAAEVDPYGTVTATVDVRLAVGVAARAPITVEVAVANASSFATSVTGSLTETTNFDEVPNASAIDTFDTRSTPWAAANAIDENEVWSPKQDGNNRLWHGADLGIKSDGTLESPDVVVGTGADFVLKFDHAYSFEADATTNYDGGVIEYKEVGGAGGDWADITKLGVSPGYGGKLDDPTPPVGNAPPPQPLPTENPLAGREAFVGESAAFPALEPVAINFGQALAGKTVRFRFRIGTDAFAGGAGWDVDNVAVVGATNTPFPQVQDEGDVACPLGPTANAGQDQTVESGDVVTLDASASTDPDNSPLTYIWTQLAGPPVALAGGDGQKPTFTAPEVSVATTLQFNVRVSDGAGVANDPVTITVNPDTGSGGSGGSAGAGGTAGSGGKAGSGNAGRAGSITFPGGGDDDDGCGCSTVGSQGAARAAWLPALAAGLALLRRRRQRRDAK